MIIVGGLGLRFFIYANVPPDIIYPGEVNHWMRVGYLMLAVMFATMVVAGLEVRFTSPPVTQNVLSSTNGSPQLPPTHSVSAVLVDPPNRLAQGENTRLELRFRLTKYDPEETALRFPVTLDPSTEYGVMVHLRAVGFEVSRLPEYLEKPQKIKVNELKTWNWTVAPKADTYGTTQKLTIDLFLLDIREERVVFQLPVTSIDVRVGAPLNLPKWVLTPSIGIGAIFVGAISFLVPWLLSHFEIRRRDR